MKLLRGKLAAKKTSPACTAELFPAFLGSFSLDWKPLSFHTAWESQILPSSWDVLCKDITCFDTKSGLAIPEQVVWVEMTILFSPQELLGQICSFALQHP